MQRRRGAHTKNNVGYAAAIATIAFSTEPNPYGHAATILTVHFVDGALDEDLLMPLVEDAAPYRGTGFHESVKMQDVIMHVWSGTLEPLTRIIRDQSCSQYTRGSHASKARRTLSFVAKKMLSNKGPPVRIRHLIIGGSSIWVIGSSVKAGANVSHEDGNYLGFRLPESEERDILPLTEFGTNSYVLRYQFNNVGFTFVEDAITASLCIPPVNLVWNETIKIIDIDLEHVRGHAAYDDIRTLLQRNNFWNSECAPYPLDAIERFSSFGVASLAGNWQPPTVLHFVEIYLMTSTTCLIATIFI